MSTGGAKMNAAMYATAKDNEPGVCCYLLLPKALMLKICLSFCVLLNGINL